METACPACAVPLVDPVGTSATLSSVVLYRCGHAFHTVCSPEGACVICLQTRVGSLLHLAAEPLVQLPSGAPLGPASATNALA